MIFFMGIVFVWDFGFYWYLFLGFVFVVVVWVVFDGLWGILICFCEFVVDFGLRVVNCVCLCFGNGGDG